MVATVNLKFDAREARTYLRRIPGATQRATARGLNKGIQQVRTQAIRSIREERNLLAREVRKTMRIVRANRNRQAARLVSTGRAIPLKQYKARVVGQRGRGKRKGNSPVQVEVRRGDKQIVRSAFLGPNGHVFRRVGARRLPIKKLFGPSVPTAMSKRAVERTLQRFAEAKVPALIERELLRELRRAA